MGVISILLVLAVGLAVNNENAPQKVENFGDLKAAIEKTVDEVKAQDKFVSYKLND